MKTLEAIKTRRSIRKFKKKEVPKDIIEKIIEAGCWAPSAMNRQPWEFIVITDEKLKSKLLEIYGLARKTDDQTAERKKAGFGGQNFNALKNAVFILCCNKMPKHSNTISVAFAIQNMVLAATELGVGSLIATAFFNAKGAVEALRKLLKIPDTMELVAFVLFGYADEQPEPKERKPLSEVIHRDKF